MSGYKTVSADTSEEEDRRYFASLREKSPAERFQMALEMTEAADRSARDEIRRLYPGAFEKEVFLRLAVQRLGRETVLKVYGWDPESGLPPPSVIPSASPAEQDRARDLKAHPDSSLRSE